MSGYTPTDEQMRYRASLVCHQGGCNIEDSEKRAEFDRFLAEVRADAWDECARSAGDMASPLMDQNPYRIEGEQ